MRATLPALLLPLCALAQPVDPAPACSWGAGAGRTVHEAAGCYVAAWHCRQPDRYAGWWHERAAVCPAALASDVVERIKAAAIAGDAAALVALRDRPMTDPVLAAALAQIPEAAYMTPAGPWVVAANGATTTRPTRGISLATPDRPALGGALALRVPVLTTRCDCTVRLVAGSATYCMVGTDPATSATAMAVCSEVRP